MFKNYLTVAIRNLLRHKGYSAINIAGLAIGMAFCILIFLYVRNECTYDTFHENASQIYRIYNIGKSPDGGENYSAMSPLPLPGVLKNDYPDLEVVSLSPLKCRMNSAEKTFQQEVTFADPEIFSVFSFPLLKGDPETALNNPNSTVISNSLARKYFGDEDPMGRVLTLPKQKYIDQSHDLIVTGVLRKIPENSSIKFDMLLSTNLLVQLDPERDKRWWSGGTYTYVRCTDAFTARELEDQLPYIRTKYMPDWLIDRGEFGLQSLASIHLDSRMLFEMIPPNSVVFLSILSAIAFSILLIACFNFMNLSTARYTERTKEIAVRKVLGAGRTQLIRQFLGEAIFMSLLSLVCGVAVAELFLPVFNSLVAKELALDHLHNLSLLFGFLGFGVVVGVMAGSFPAFFLTTYNPLQGLKKLTKKTSGSFAFRRVLVVVQFAISIVLIVCVLVVIKQVRYMKNKDLGFNPNNIIVVQTPVMPETYLNAIESEKTSAGILAVCLSEDVPGRNYRNKFGVEPEGWQGGASLEMKVTSVDERFLDAYEMQLTDGRNFSLEFGADMAQSVLLSEEAVKKIGWRPAIGKRIKFVHGEGPYTVIGVVRDIHFQSLQNNVAPLVYRYVAEGQVWRMQYISARIYPGNTREALTFLEKKWREIAPDNPFEYFFLKEEFNKNYQAEDKITRIIGGFSLLAIFLACLGSFGLVALAATQRTKEIGIRKTLGASVAQIVLLLSREFIILLGVAILIACPVAWYFMDRWLQDFAYRIDLGPETFVLGGLLALTITLLTVSFQAVKAARTNPVDALRYE